MGMKHKYAGKEPMVSGETVTPGKFICLNCDHKLEVKKGVVNLPVCPRCQGDTWRPA
jgi:Zn finger protein HypA/HybF involved in hydrogenase expression